jgi:nitrate reductase gamma subunit
MKKTLIILPFLIFSFICTSIADASWIIDPEKFHVSAHGEFSCADCHDNIPDREVHPDPAEVNKEIGDFFNEDRCYTCHDSVPDDIEEGTHGGEELDPGISYNNCLECHNPHEDPGSDAMSDGYDPSKPPREQCVICHGEQPESLPVSPDNENCLTCHGQTATVDSHTFDNRVLCLSCHAEESMLIKSEKGEAFQVISKESYQSAPHAAFSCTECHKAADQYPHNNQIRTGCLECHARHDEKVAHDMHALVSCEACHIQSAKPVKDPDSKKIVWEPDWVQAESAQIHDMAIDDGSCIKCHFKDNAVGAAAMVLPAKGILCMPCHASTFSVSHPTTFIFLLIFIAGFISLFSVWLSGSFKGSARNGKGANLIRLIMEICKAVFSRKIIAVIKTMILDVLLQKRLFIQSGARWAIHSLIFIPFVFRFIWGLTALIASLWFPEGDMAWVLIDKNAPAAALLFDVSGVMILTGVILAFIRGTRKNRKRLQALPKQDKAALILIGLIVIAGFILEGIRIAMTGRPDNSGYAFIGQMISNIFSNPVAAGNIYGQIWYMHAVITGVFIAYLPFSRLLHIIMGPFILAANAATKGEH